MSDYTGYAFKCRLCGIEFTTQEEADSHYEDVHRNDPDRSR